MKRVRQPRQRLSNQEEKEPGDRNAKGELCHAHEAGQSTALIKRASCEVRQTARAKDTVFMFCDALAAEELFAFGATGCGLASSMIEAALVSQISHESQRQVERTGGHSSFFDGFDGHAGPVGSCGMHGFGGRSAG